MEVVSIIIYLDDLPFGSVCLLESRQRGYGVREWSNLADLTRTAFKQPLVTQPWMYNKNLLI